MDKAQDLELWEENVLIMECTSEYDYLVHPKLHLGCALEEELKGKTIHEQYHEASSKAHEDDVAKALRHMDDDGNYITKDIPEEKEE